MDLIEAKGKRKCFYCGVVFSACKVKSHVMKKHKDAIRCENWRCATYFHTEEERKQHDEEVHQKSKERKMLPCLYCGKEFRGIRVYRQHVKHGHVDHPVKCLFVGCLFYFKSIVEMRIHHDNDHKKDLVKKIHKCEQCHFKTKTKESLKRHIQRLHPTNATSFKCDACKKEFQSEAAFNRHNNHVHKLSTCKYCLLSVPYLYMHVEKKFCQRCKHQFDCSGLLQKHRNKCKQTLFKCVSCQKKFKIKSSLDCHMKGKCGKIRPSKPQPRNNANARFECDICKKMLLTKVALAEHITNNHLVIECKHCKLSVRLIYLHLEQKKCSRCEKSFSCHGILEYHRKLCPT